MVLRRQARQGEKLALGVETAIGDESMKMGVEIHQIAESLNSDDYTWKEIITIETGLIELFEAGIGTEW